jgi:tetratricopeptide (TPR) repeat protein
MPSSRVEALRAMVEQNPQHGFARYGLAMEYANTGEYDNAISEFRSLLEIDANYAAAYYHLGRTYERAGRIDDARSTYQKGIEVTRRTGDSHTQSELQAALDVLG